MLSDSGEVRRPSKNTYTLCLVNVQQANHYLIPSVYIRLKTLGNDSII